MNSTLGLQSPNVMTTHMMAGLDEANIDRGLKSSCSSDDSFESVNSDDMIGNIPSEAGM